MPVVVGAYPSWSGDPALAAGVVAGLALVPGVGGLELPWHGSFEVPAGCPDRWRHVVTLIPGTMARLEGDPAYGLASPDAAGREAALADLAEVREAVVAAGTVRAVELHSAPRRTASADALAASLAEVAGWDWGGATLVVEHCDAWVDEGSQKGFLPFAAELDVVAGVTGPTPVRVGVNWGRSVIESRDVSTPERQVADAAGRGLLGALMFSSVSDRDTAYGPAWVDAHLVPAEVTGAPPGTLLTGALLRRCVQAAGPGYDGVLGLKVGLRPDTLAADERVDRLLQTVALVAGAGS